MSAKFTNISTDLPSVLSGGSTTTTDADKKYTSDELNAMTVEQIKALAAERNYTITKTAKADIISEFLTQQGE